MASLFPGHDGQWELNRRNFDGTWLATSRWYERQGNIPLDLSRSSSTKPDTRYAITFSDADNGVWDGSGLSYAAGGAMVLPMTRATYNGGGTGGCWHFDSTAGQSSTSVNAASARFGHEVNLFTARSRSMLILLWTRAGEGEAARWRLNSVGAPPFRCQRGGAPDPPRCALKGVTEMLEEQRGWKGTVETLVPGEWPVDAPAPQACEAFRPELFACNEVTAGFEDGLVCSVPEYLPDGAFVLHVGCRLEENRFDQVSLVFDTSRNLARWELPSFSRGSS